MCIVFLPGNEFFAIVVSRLGSGSDILYFVAIFLQLVNSIHGIYLRSFIFGLQRDEV